MRRALGLNARGRLIAVGLTVTGALLLLLTAAPVRRAAADFLGLFRVRQFAVIPLDATQMEHLTALAERAESVLGEPTVVREPGEARTVSDAEEAAAAAGFAVRLPAALPAVVEQHEIRVQSGPALRLELDRAALQALLSAVGADSVGASVAADGSKALLPDAETIAIDLDVPAVVSLKMGAGDGIIVLTQLPSPEITLPDGVDPAALAEVAFRLVDMLPEDARRLAATIDWGSTLVIPLPTEWVEYREVSVDGVTGLLVQSTAAPGDARAHGEQVLLWENGGIVYALSGVDVQPELLLLVADSLS